MNIEEVMLNEALDKAFSLYINNKENEESLEYNGFLCSVVRMLVIIYGEDIIKHFEDKKKDLIEKEILKYGFSKKEFNNFKLAVDKFYSFDLKMESKPIKKKNKYFNLVQKYLIDMMVQRKSKDTVDKEILNNFYNLLFTANSKTFYQKSYAVLKAYNPYEIDEYAKKQNIVGDGNEENNNNK